MNFTESPISSCSTLIIEPCSNGAVSDVVVDLALGAIVDALVVMVVDDTVEGAV